MSLDERFLLVIARDDGQIWALPSHNYGFVLNQIRNLSKSPHVQAGAVLYERIAYGMRVRLKQHDFPSEEEADHLLAVYALKGDEDGEVDGSDPNASGHGADEAE